ncbi:MAG: hypothetical protein WCR01_05240 [Bacteroidota bacterium]
MDISLVASGNIDVSLKPVNVPDLLKELLPFKIKKENSIFV